MERDIPVFLVESDLQLRNISCYSSILIGVGLWKQQVIKSYINWWSYTALTDKFLHQVMILQFLVILQGW